MQNESAPRVQLPTYPLAILPRGVARCARCFLSLTNRVDLDLPAENFPISAPRLKRARTMRTCSKIADLRSGKAEFMAAALREKRLPVAYLPFEGEQHGFRRAENIKRALDAELYFYSGIFGFELADPVRPVSIENL